MRRRIVLGLMSAAAAVVALFPRGPALAARQADKDTAFLAGMVRTHALPRFDALVTAATAYADTLDRFAANPTAAGLDEGRSAHIAVTDAWAAVQHLRPGPLTMNLRADRISFWPERPGVVQRQIGQILRDHDPKLLQPEALARQSAAVQGLTVLERLLFDDAVTVDSFAGSDAKLYRAKLAAAAARNIAHIATEARDGWKELEGPLAAGRETVLGPTPTEAVNTLFSSAITAMQVIVDQKLMAPLGTSIEDAKPLVVEALRSRRGLPNIAQNLKGLRALLMGEHGGPGFISLLPESEDGATAKQAIDESFAAAIGAIEAVPGPLDKAVSDPAARKKTESALRLIKAARVEMLGTLAPLLDITLGFNELDGD
ncbi:imelysin family protein [Azospirillum picis]|uniref:Lipoprotein n=1 Tax=Azospirillum picis TaxID=488438 RepID=A0ABU0MLS2_9PROT|nr:imelysin family protein [Azospirillum picis]MBP2300967.1 putative lipoprotein [Azospirillum picis]MDQ0534413.1 putative lipoprotein [Azospirillum picis]